ncbi:N-6 DNA methylase [Parabacteroides sp. FAFU027]|nr:N-6 DNA methylase [Parabacteroides sp. FAFU027]
MGHNEYVIRRDKTLSDILFIDKFFDVIVANPPYGVDWKLYRIFWPI